MPDIWVTEKGVLKLQRALNISKVVGPGVIRYRVFRELSTELAPILTLLSQTSLHQEPLPDIWKHACFDKVAHNRLLYKLSSYVVKENTLG